MSDDEPPSPAFKARRKRNIVLAVLLAAFGILIYLMSLVQWHEHFG
jgi:hypothetical protein